MINKTQAEFNWRVLLSTRTSMAYAIAGVVAALVVILAGIIPQIQGTIELVQQLETEKPKLESLKQKLVELDQIQFTPEYSQISIVNTALPSKKPLLELLMSLQSIAASNQVLVTELQLNPGDIATSSATAQMGAATGTTITTAPTPTPAPAGATGTGANSGLAVGSLTLGMTVKGTQAQVQSFLTMLEKATPFTTITQLSVERIKDTNGQTNTMEARVKTDTSFFTQPITAALEAPLPQLSDEERQVLSSISAFVENELPEQTQVTSGGVEDLFGVSPLLFK